MKLNIGPKSTIASIDVDAQYGFTYECPNELPVPDALAIVPELNTQATFAALRIGSKDAHPREAIWAADVNHSALTPISGKHVDVRWPMHCVPGTKGFNLIANLPHPSEYDYFVWKGIEPDMHPYGACYHDLNNTLSTGLIEYLKTHRILTVLVGGLALDYCVKNTALQLSHAGFKTIVNLKASRSISASTAQSAIREMQQQGIIIIDSCSQLEHSPLETSLC